MSGKPPGMITIYRKISLAMVGEYKQYLQRISPGFLYNGLVIVYRGYKQIIKPFRIFIFLLKHKKVEAKHKKALEYVRSKEKIKAAFFINHDSDWKYEGVYRIMEHDERFEPVIIICPYLTYGEEQMLEVMKNGFNVFSEKGYNVIKTLRDDGTWLDVKNEVQPDLIFFANPYLHTRAEYYITNFPDTLTFYVPYAFVITDRPSLRYQLELHYLVYKIFRESDYHSKQARKYSLNRGSNSIVSGYPGLDFVFKDNSRNNAGDQDKSLGNDPWKIKDRQVKRIIWAPHHSIETDKSRFNFSNFLEYHQFFLDLADKYKDDIMLSFKPHPLLKPKLKNLPGWGEERTENYYKAWATRPNCQLNEGMYYDLFLSSDAMIHDSVSFLVEYLCTKKPSLYMVIDDYVLSGFSTLGNKIVDAHYHSRTKEDVESFIKDVVISGEDTMKQRREALIKTHLQPPNNNSASRNIMNEIYRITGK